jgi:hypothetical protein
MNKSNERARAMKMLKATAVLLLNISGATPITIMAENA